MHRWEEEVELVVEEMSRVLRYMDWRSHYWHSLVSKCDMLDATVREGIAAYAGKQAYIAQMMAHRFSKQWLSALESHCITLDWPVHYTSHESILGTTVSFRSIGHTSVTVTCFIISTIQHTHP
jgi:hypothetical protein